VTCGPEAAAYLPVQRPPVGTSRDLYWFGPSGSWRPVPDVPPQGLPSATRVATVGDRLVLDLGPRLFTLPPGGATWVVHASPGGQRWYGAGARLVSIDNLDGFRIRVIDVDALPAA
jgi:hypothetical protein